MEELYRKWRTWAEAGDGLIRFCRHCGRQLWQCLVPPFGHPTQPPGEGWACECGKEN